MGVLRCPGRVRPAPSPPRNDQPLPVIRPAELRLGDLRIEGWSLAGDETWFRVHPPGLAFDTGRGTARLAGAHDVFLSHGHLDHSDGS